MRDEQRRSPVRPPLNEAEQRLRDRLRQHVEALATAIGPRHMHAPGTMDAAASYIERELTQVAGERVTRHCFRVENDTADNLIMERRGTSRPDRVMIVGAHYDTVPDTPGADDNASAVAMLIEIARLLISRPPRRTLRFVAFANEEAPHHNMGTMGSDHYVRLCVADESVRIVGMISLEMVGYFRTEPGSQRIPPSMPRVMRHVLPKRGDFLAAVANPGSMRLLYTFWRGVRRARRRVMFLPIALPERIREITLSDHRAFWDAGVSALMVTDTSFLRNPHYHEPTDTPATLDFDRMARATVGVANGIAACAGIRARIRT